MKLNLKEFATILIFGIPKCGKSNLIKNIVYNAAKNNYIDHCVLFSATKDKEDYDYIDDRYKYDSLNLDTLKRYVQICKEENKRNIVSRGLIIMDDTIGDLEMKQPFFTNLFAMHRHYGLSIIVASQAIISVPPNIKSMVTHGCVFKFISENDLERIHSCFGTLCPSKKEFIEKYHRLTDEPFKFFCYTKTDAFDIENAYCGYRAPLLKRKFKIES